MILLHAINGALLLPLVPLGLAAFVDFLHRTPTDGADQ